MRCVFNTGLVTGNLQALQRRWKKILAEINKINKLFMDRVGMSVGVTGTSDPGAFKWVSCRSYFDNKCWMGGGVSLVALGAESWMLRNS